MTPTPSRFRRQALLLPGLFLSMVAAHAADAGLVLTQGEVHTDPVGTVIAVTIQNNGTQTVGSAVVSCEFTVRGKAAGSAATTIYNVLPGGNGADQVHMMGVNADAATCRIGATTPSAT